MARKTQSETISGVISDIDTSQLAHSNNTISPRDIATQTQYQSTKCIHDDPNVDSKTAYSASLKSDPDPKVENEMSRFCKEHQIPESAKVQGKETKGM